MSKLSQEDINRIFGMTDALKKLDELVDMATVGGKKEKAEEPEENKYAGSANETWKVYESFCDAGFSEDQAFALTVEMIRASGRK